METFLSPWVNSIKISHTSANYTHKIYFTNNSVQCLSHQKNSDKRTLCTYHYHFWGKDKNWWEHHSLKCRAALKKWCRFVFFVSSYYRAPVTAMFLVTVWYLFIDQFNNRSINTRWKTPLVIIWRVKIVLKKWILFLKTNKPPSEISKKHRLIFALFMRWIVHCKQYVRETYHSHLLCLNKSCSIQLIVIMIRNLEASLF